LVQRQDGLLTIALVPSAHDNVGVVNCGVAVFSRPNFLTWRRGGHFEILNDVSNGVCPPVGVCIAISRMRAWSFEEDLTGQKRLPGVG
jgi:hypothetical protein